MIFFCACVEETELVKTYLDQCSLISLSQMASSLEFPTLHLLKKLFSIHEQESYHGPAVEAISPSAPGSLSYISCS